MRARTLAPLVMLVAGLLAETGAEAASFAVLPVKGPKGSAPRDVERALLDRLETRGDEGHLGEPRAGERSIRAEIRKRGRVFKVELSLTGPEGGEPIARRVGTYHPRRGISSVIAVLLDRLLDGATGPRGLESGSGSGDAEEGPIEDEVADAGEDESDVELAVADEAELPPGESSEATEPATIANTAEVPPVAEATVEADRGLGLEFGFALGTQLLSRYTLSVESGPTALAYRASPLFLLSPSVFYRDPASPLWVGLRGELAQVGFTLSTEPALTPEVARGAFLGVGLEAGWAFEVGGDFSLAPVLGLRLERLGVDEQAVVDPGQAAPIPFDVVLSSLAVVPEILVRARYAFSERFDALLFGGLRLVASYAESPTDSGAAGPGFGAAVGAEARFVIVRWLSLQLQARYQFSTVSFSGPATRQAFANDPPLVETSVAYEDLKLSLGPVLRL